MNSLSKCARPSILEAESKIRGSSVRGIVFADALTHLIGSVARTCATAPQCAELTRQIATQTNVIIAVRGT